LKRIAIVGNGGSGKSVLARELGRRLGLPVLHLDARFWKPGWVETPDGEWEALQAGLVAGDEWIADGNYLKTLPLRTARADTIVFLDMPRLLCLRSVLSRWLRSRGTTRGDMAPGCPERVDLDFVKWIWNYRRRSRPGILARLREFEAAGGRVLVLRTRREVAEFLAGIGGAGEGAGRAGPAP